MRDCSQFLTINYKLKTPYSTIEKITVEKRVKTREKRLPDSVQRRNEKSNGIEWEGSKQFFDGYGRKWWVFWDGKRRRN